MTCSRAQRKAPRLWTEPGTSWNGATKLMLGPSTFLEDEEDEERVVNHSTPVPVRSTKYEYLFGLGYFGRYFWGSFIKLLKFGYFYGFIFNKICKL